MADFNDKVEIILITTVNKLYAKAESSVLDHKDLETIHTCVKIKKDLDNTKSPIDETSARKPLSQAEAADLLDLVSKNSDVPGQ